MRHARKPNASLPGSGQTYLGLERIGVTDNFFELGGDSILIIQVISRCRRAGLDLSARDFWEAPTIAKLASVVPTKSQPSDAEPMSGWVQLTPIQHWFFEQELERRHHWNQAFLFEVSHDIDLAILEQSLRLVVTHHDSLSLRFRKTTAGWIQELAASISPITIVQYDLSLEPLDRRAAAVETYCSIHQSNLDLENGPLLSAAHFAFGLHERGRLLLVVHHLAIDGVSWRILIEDLEVAYSSL